MQNFRWWNLSKKRIFYAIQALGNRPIQKYSSRIIFEEKPVNIINNIRSWNRTRRLHATLDGLSARQLNDIGMDRRGNFIAAGNPR